MTHGNKGGKLIRLEKNKFYFLLEQVVPSCSPYVELDEKPYTSQQSVASSQEKSSHDAVNDEKPSIATTSKRQIRHLIAENKSPDLKEINFFDDDEIFG